MNIGIVGVGVVGSACKVGFEHIGHTVKVHDIKLHTKIDDVLDTEICYISVPTPTRDDDSCDVRIVESVVKDNVMKSKVRAASMGSLKEAAEDFMACVSVAESILKK